MSRQPVALPADLQEGLLPIEAVDGVDLLGNPEWDAETGGWVLSCRITLNTPDHPQIPRHTDWYLIIGDAYPWADIKVYPSKKNGITATFHHQNLNGPGSDDSLWRDGKLCLETSMIALGRLTDTEPHTASERLRWRIERLKEWIRAAANETLVRAGDPWELPDFRPRLKPVVCFTEDDATASFWNDNSKNTGYLQVGKCGQKLLAVQSVTTQAGDLLFQSEWGFALSKIQEGETSTGIWIRLNEVPHLKPWQAPKTWGELAEACEAQGLDLFEELRHLAPRLRDGKTHVCTFVFRAPRIVGAEADRVLWLPVMLPTLSPKDAKFDGFRPGEKAAWLRDRRERISSTKPVIWLECENSSYAELAGRGRYRDELTSSRIVMIGAGTIGSLISDVLVRGGVRELIIVDNDDLSVGNLARHRLDLSDVGLKKASSLAAHLNHSFPHAEVTAIDKAFPPEEQLHRETIRSANLVLDCTGSDSALGELERFDWQGERLFISLSSGFAAHRIFCYAARDKSFPMGDFQTRIQPWLLKERPAFDENNLPRDGMACWHPLFPARIDHLTLMVSLAVQWIEHHVLGSVYLPDLSVYELSESDGVIENVKRLSTPDV